MQRATNCDELIKTYYGGRSRTRWHRHRQAMDYGRYRGHDLDKSAEPLLARYGRDWRAHANGKPRVELSFSVDDGATLERTMGPARFEEYVAAATLGEGEFEEYVVDQAALAGQTSLSDAASDPATDPQAEYLVDVADPLGEPRGANRFDPPETRSTAATPTTAAQGRTTVAKPADRERSRQPSQPVPSAGVPAQAPVEHAQESSHRAASDDDFISDMQAILTRQKVYDPVTKTMVDADKLGQRASTDPRQDQGASAQLNNSQAIFDKIAQSMQYANKYDLGTVEMENRFADFDRMSDLQQKAEADERAKRAQARQAKAAVAGATDVDSQDFIQDLDAIHYQRGRGSARSSGSEDPFAFVPPPSPDDSPGAGWTEARSPGVGWSGGTSPGPSLAGTGGGGASSISIPGIQVPEIRTPDIQIPGLQLPGPQAVASFAQSDLARQQDTPTVSPFPPTFADPLSFKDDKKLSDAFNAALTAVKANADYYDLPNIEDLPIVIVPLNDDGSRPFIGRHYADMYYVGSMAKIAAMYAAFHLRHAVNKLAATLDPAKISDQGKFFAAVRKAFDDQILKASDLIRNAKTTGNRSPQYERIFTATQDAAGKWSVTFRSDANPKFDFAGHLKKMVVDSHNPSAGFCIQALGFSWIDGLLQKAGLFDVRSKKGIWLAGDYLWPKPVIDAAHADSHGDAEQKEEFDLAISGWAEVKIPSDNDGDSKQATTCAYAARLFVLLFDNKLVPTTDPADSANTEMQDMLHQAVTGAQAASIVGRFPSVPPPFAVLQTKIGVGQLGSSGSCNPDPVTHQTHGCVLSESMIVQQAAAPHRKFVVVWQNVKDPANSGFKEVARIRDIIQKTMDGYHP
jgi:hypothetical protein